MKKESNGAVQACVRLGLIKPFHQKRNQPKTTPKSEKCKYCDGAPHGREVCDKCIVY